LHFYVAQIFCFRLLRIYSIKDLVFIIMNFRYFGKNDILSSSKIHQANKKNDYKILHFELFKIPIHSSRLCSQCLISILYFSSISLKSMVLLLGLLAAVGN